MANPFPYSYTELNPVFGLLKANGVHCYEYHSGGGNYHIAIPTKTRFVLVSVDDVWSIATYPNETAMYEDQAVGDVNYSDLKADADPSAVVKWIIPTLNSVKSQTQRAPRVTDRTGE